MANSIHIYPIDNVAVAVTDLPAGSLHQHVSLAEDIPMGHKFALSPISKGENIIKYGFPIGHATVDIAPGSWVHTQNVKTNLSDLLEYRYKPSFMPIAPEEAGSFMGYRRPDGRVGIRNELWIIPTVGCVNSVAERLERMAQKWVGGSVEGIYSFVHPYGCSQMGDDHENTVRLLSALAAHPNAGGILILGLGCENNQLSGMLEALGGRYDPEHIKLLQCQDVEDEYEAGLGLLEELAASAARYRREPIPAGELVIGLKCGGSDGFSGITANPLVGSISDKLIAQGGTALLTEVPEMFGAETLLMDRCLSPEIFEKTVRLINDFKQYYIDNNQVVYENPSPGNKKGGITTLEDKSLGCTQKGGTAPVTDVLRYGQPVTEKGLNLLQAPGNDLIASTALAASGAHIILFTTGRGTPFGCPVPTVKIASNSGLASRKPGWIDFNAGQLLEGKTMREVTGELFAYLLQLASGETQTNNERYGFREIAIFKGGVTL